MGKIRYVCTSCGNGFTTLSAAKRHVKNVERASGTAVSEASYRTGLLTGVFWPPIPRIRPRYKKEPAELSTIGTEELFRGYWRRVGELLSEEDFKVDSKKQSMRQILDLYFTEELKRTLLDNTGYK